MFPSSILNGYVLQDTVTILNHTVLVASFYNEELEDEYKCIEYADSTDKGFPNWGLMLLVKDVMDSGLTLVCTQSGGEPTGGIANR